MQWLEIVNYFLFLDLKWIIWDSDFRGFFQQSRMTTILLSKVYRALPSRKIKLMKNWVVKQELSRTLFTIAGCVLNDLLINCCRCSSNCKPVFWFAAVSWEFFVCITAAFFTVQLYSLPLTHFYFCLKKRIWLMQKQKKKWFFNIESTVR